MDSAFRYRPAGHVATPTFSGDDDDAHGRTRLRLVFLLVLFLLGAAANAWAATADATAVASRTAVVDGLKIGYLIAGSGAPVILLHGYTRTSRMWKPIIPLLAGKFRVIAPDLPGIGDSGIPSARDAPPRYRPPRLAGA